MSGWPPSTMHANPVLAGGADFFDHHRNVVVEVLLHLRRIVHRQVL